MRRVKIFISSPGDVIPERLIVQRVVARLNKSFSDHLVLETLFWEREPLEVTSDYQSLITPPSEADIVITILWSRLGTPLNSERYRGAVTGKSPVTGTEWEFEEAYAHHTQTGNKPHLMLYLKTAVAYIPNDASALEAIEQKRALEAFLEHWLLHEEGSFKGASHTFETPDSFEEMLETHLQELLKKEIGTSLEHSPKWYQGSPFRGLQSFELEHAQLFFGRKRAITELRESLTHQVNKGNAFLLVLGASGSGKSSLIKAGLLPDLILPGMIDNVAVTRYALLTPSDDPSDLVLGLSKALLSETALPELEQLQFDAVKLADHLLGAPTVVHPIRQAVAKISEERQLTEIAKVRVVIIIDQLEEIFTLKSIDDTQRKTYIDLLSALARSGDVWIIATMRSDFFGYLEQLPELMDLSQNRGRYLLALPDEAEIAQMINRPAKEAGLHFEIDTKSGIGLDEELRKSAAKNPASLPLLEYMLEQLWQQRSKSGLLSYKTYRALGTLEGALGQKAEEVFESLRDDVQKTLVPLLKMLVIFSENDDRQNISKGDMNRSTARKVPMRMIEKNPDMLTLVKTLLSPEVRLLESGSDEKGEVYVHVTHEALFTHWERAKKIIAEEQDDILLRDRLQIAATHWQKYHGKDKESLLLSEGLPLERAKDLLERSRAELEEDIKSYIEASVTSQKKKERYRQRTTIGVVVSSLLIALFMGKLTIDANQEERRANEAVTKAKHYSEMVLEQKRQISLIAVKTIETLAKTDLTLLNEYIDAILISDSKDAFIALLRPLIQETESMDEDEKQEWLELTDSMTIQQVHRLIKILFTEKNKLSHINTKYQQEIELLLNRPELATKKIQEELKQACLKEPVVDRMPTNQIDDGTQDTIKMIETLAASDKEVLMQYLDDLLKKGRKEDFQTLLEPLVLQSDSIETLEKEYWLAVSSSMSVEQLYELARILLTEKYTLVHLEMERAQKEHPCLQLANILIVSKVTTEDPLLYLEAYKERRSSVDPKYYYLSGKLFTKREQFAEALKVYLIAIEKEPENATYTEALVDLYQKMDKPHKAVTWAEKLIDLRAAALSQTNDKAEQETLKIKLLKDLTRLAELQASIGSQFLIDHYKHEYDPLLDEMRSKALSQYLSIKMLLARAFFDTRMYDRGKKEYILLFKAYEESPHKDTINRSWIASEYTTLSWYLLFTKEYASAIVNAQKGLKLDPQDKSSETNLAHAYLLSGEIEKAHKLYVKNKGQLLGNQKRLWDDVIREDFTLLREANITSEQFTIVEDLLAD